MVKPEWGTKRTCPNCGARYYDMHHDPIICPKCGTAFDAEAVLKTRRVRVAAPVEVPEPVVEEEIDAGLEPDGAVEAEEEDAEAAVADGEEEEEEEEEVIEDASELGEDTDDMAEVIENVEDDEER